MEKLKVSRNKIVKGDQLARMLAQWRFRDEKIVFTNGCFDVLHPGHIEYLSKARDLGSKLVIGLNTDDSVKRLKGNNRPIITEDYRALMLASLHFVDAVVLFDQDTPLELIEVVQPDVLIKGADYKPEDIVGFEVVTAKGGVVETINLVDGFSTTSLIKKLKEE